MTERSVAGRIADHAARQPDGLAYATRDARMTWAEYDARSTAFAEHLVALGFAPGERVRGGSTILAVLPGAEA